MCCLTRLLLRKRMHVYASRQLHAHTRTRVHTNARTYTDTRTHTLLTTYIVVDVFIKKDLSPDAVGHEGCGRQHEETDHEDEHGAGVDADTHPGLGVVVDGDVRPANTSCHVYNRCLSK